jgi:hypothetical protein
MRPARIALILAVAALAAGCGRRGAPEEPPLPPGVQAIPINPDVPGSATAPNRKFVLDPLLD